MASPEKLSVAEKTNLILWISKNPEVCIKTDHEAAAIASTQLGLKLTAQTFSVYRRQQFPKQCRESSGDSKRLDDLESRMAMVEAFLTAPPAGRAIQFVPAAASPISVSRS